MWSRRKAPSRHTVSMLSTPSALACLRPFRQPTKDTLFELAHLGDRKRHADGMGWTLPVVLFRLGRLVHVLSVRWRKHGTNTSVCASAARIHLPPSPCTHVSLPNPRTRVTWSLPLTSESSICHAVHRCINTGQDSESRGRGGRLTVHTPCSLNAVKNAGSVVVRLPSTSYMSSSTKRLDRARFAVRVRGA